mmetsp:Transcript_45393/g.135435  ORF Transcript_45393/g.135435 Transcript_45393/m.135435 type:complete len:290 (+) Transcript_45393:1590-2459(+)
MVTKDASHTNTVNTPHADGSVASAGHKGKDTGGMLTPHASLNKELSERGSGAAMSSLGGDFSLHGAQSGVPLYGAGGSLHGSGALANGSLLGGANGLLHGGAALADAASLHAMQDNELYGRDSAASTRGGSGGGVIAASVRALALVSPPALSDGSQLGDSAHGSEAAAQRLGSTTVQRQGSAGGARRGEPLPLVTLALAGQRLGDGDAAVSPAGSSGGCAVSPRGIAATAAISPRGIGCVRTDGKRTISTIEEAAAEVEGQSPQARDPAAAAAALESEGRVRGGAAVVH